MLDMPARRARHIRNSVYAIHRGGCRRHVAQRSRRGGRYNCENGGPAPEKLTDAIYANTGKLSKYYTAAEELPVDLSKPGTATFLVQHHDTAKFGNFVVQARGHGLMLCWWQDMPRPHRMSLAWWFCLLCTDMLCTGGIVVRQPPDRRTRQAKVSPYMRR